VLIAQSRLTTAHILYRNPDHPWLLQEYVWQDYDRVPGFPALNKFLKFWREKIDGPIHSVQVADADFMHDLRYTTHQAVLH